MQYISSENMNIKWYLKNSGSADRMHMNQWGGAALEELRREYGVCSVQCAVWEIEA